MDFLGDISELKTFRKRSNESSNHWIKEERNALLKKVSAILQKAETDRTEDEQQVLLGCTEVTQEVTKRLQRQQQLKSRQEEVEDPPSVLADKCCQLATAISKARHLVVYTGAGISTAACIPDYRGPNGVWTRLQQGKDIGCHDLSQAEPTVTHMALSELYWQGKLKHIVSQNCDGLHLRSGLPRTALSEVHGNMLLEVCRSCSPPCEYLRLFDVTERTARFNHHTRRRCHACGGPLQDSIVHFGERGSLKWPLNWSATTGAARTADVILCLGSSLKVLKKYPWLWCMDMPVKKRPLLYIVNLQWTPKDEQATLKINGKCDEVILQVMEHLQFPIPKYERSNDPIFSHATQLHPSELRTTSRPLLLSTAALEESPLELTPSATVQHQSKCLVKEDSENILCNLESTSMSPVIKTENLAMDCPLDLTMKSVEYKPETNNGPINIDLSVPWFNVQYLLSTKCGVKQEPCVPLPKGECPFCWTHYSSMACLFYPRRSLTALAVLSDSSEEEDGGGGDSGDAAPKPIKAANPGWFGKGYRKAKVKKRRTT